VCLADEFAVKKSQRQSVFNGSRSERLPVAAPLAIGPPMASRTRSLGRGCEHDFGREKRAPFAGGGVLLRRAADEFVATIKCTDKRGRAETGNCFNRCQTEPRRIF